MMRIELVKRPQQSRFYMVMSPIIALGLTVVIHIIEHR